MLTKKYVALVICFSSPFPIFADQWDVAAKAITRLSPREFPALPPTISSKLVKMGCTIPQPSYFSKNKSNVIVGSFAQRGQKDFAVLCSRNGKSHVQVFWGGSQRCKSQLALDNDRGYLQTLDADTIGYSRAIGVASQKAIASYRTSYGGPKPADTKHSGIEDIFIEKASTVFYCANGKWSELAGAD